MVVIIDECAKSKPIIRNKAVALLSSNKTAIDTNKIIKTQLSFVKQVVQQHLQLYLHLPKPMQINHF